jgi:UDP-2,3-diacylglucosamine hydrolase
MPIGLIAGNGTFPFLVLRAARRLGHDVTVVGISGEAFPELETLAREVGQTSFDWVELGALGKCIAVLKDAGVSRAVMAGQVKHVKLFSGVAPDAMLLSAMRRLPAANTDALIAAVAGVLEENGITLMDSTSLLSDLMAPPGVLTTAAPDDRMRADFEFGYRVADALAGLDVGQTIAVKVSKPGQDMRFDVPVVGRATIAAMQASGADGLSIDAGKTLMVDGDAVIQAANESGIVVVGRAASQGGG